MSSKPKSEQTLIENKFKKKHESFITYIVLTLIVGYAAFLLISTQTEISQKQNQYENLHTQLTDIETVNDQLERYTEEENRAEYMEEVARDKLDYAHPRERIYYIIPTS